MPPIMKDSGTLTATPETNARSGSAPGALGDAARQQAVALDIPVTIHGARTMEGSDKREPFSESTKTVLVFGSGAVIRLSSAMAPGQLLFLTNERTKKEVVCQVVKSKNHRNVSGYVELEFTEPAVGFWGMRFPGDRLSPGPETAPAAVRPSAANGSPASARAMAPKIEQPEKSKATGSVAAKLPTPAPPSAKAATPAPAASSIVPVPLDSSALLGTAKPKDKHSGAPVTPVSTPVGSEEKLVEPWLKKPQPVSQVQAPATRPLAASPETTANSSAADSDLSLAPTFELSRASDKPASILAPSEPPANLSSVDLSSLVPFFEVKPAASAPPPVPQVPAASDAETEELKEHTARLQEQLSSLQFAEPASTAPTEPAAETPFTSPGEHSTPLLKTNSVHESAVQLFENTSASNPSAVLPEPLEPEKIAPAPPTPSLESLEHAELKIPAWLEPLARNTAAPTSTPELVFREKAKRIAEQPQQEEITADLAAPAEPQQIAESRVPQFGSVLHFEEAESASESTYKKSSKGVPVGAIAAGVAIALLGAGGWWYMNQRSAGVQTSVVAAQAADTAPATTLPARPQTDTPSQANSPTHTDSAVSGSLPAKAESPAHISAASNSSGSLPVGSSTTTGRNPQPSSNSLTSATMVTRSSSPASEQPAPVEVKKPSLGSVHLAPPKIAKGRHAQNAAEIDAGLPLSEVPSEADADGLNSGLEVGSKQPAAPVVPGALGGDVKPAKLLSSAPPVYPALARAQHVAGNVTIDALIDANGRVTSMKVISGPVLLQQAAMDALRQWKYQPANLDGKAVPMHLTVTIQFRLQ